MGPNDDSPPFSSNLCTNVQWLADLESIIDVFEHRGLEKGDYFANLANIP